MMEVLDFKCWYYEIAQQAGTTSVPRCMPLEQIPEQYREAARTIRQMPEYTQEREKENENQK